MAETQRQGKTDLEHISKPPVKEQEPIEVGPQTQPLPLQTALESPHRLRPSEVLSIQRTVGNRATGQLLSTARSPAGIIQRETISEDLDVEGNISVAGDVIAAGDIRSWGGSVEAAGNITAAGTVTGGTQAAGAGTQQAGSAGTQQTGTGATQESIHAG